MGSFGDHSTILLGLCVFSVGKRGMQPCGHAFPDKAKVDQMEERCREAKASAQKVLQRANGQHEPDAVQSTRGSGGTSQHMPGTTTM